MITADDTRHGTYAGYIAGCRDDCCITVRRSYDKMLRDEHRAGIQRRPRRRHDEFIIDLVWERGAPFDAEPLSPSEKGEICRRWVAKKRSLRSLKTVTGWNTSRYYHINPRP